MRLKGLYFTKLLCCAYFLIGEDGERSLEAYIDKIQMVFEAQIGMVITHPATQENKNQHKKKPFKSHLALCCL